MPEHLLEIKNLNVRYGDFIALSDVSINVGKGEIVSVLGTNGAGKTTLMMTVAGLIPSASGKVVFNGEDVTGAQPDKMVRKGLCLVPQGGRCFSRMSVQDNLLVGGYDRDARHYTKESLERVYTLFPDLHEKRNVPAGSLSGGQRQMVAIGRALMSRPKILLFDELSLGLAPVVIKSIYQVIRRICSDEGTSIVLVEQDTRRAMRMTDRTYIMLKGRVVLEGSPDELSEETVKRAYLGI